MNLADNLNPAQFAELLKASMTEEAQSPPPEYDGDVGGYEGEGETPAVEQEQVPDEAAPVEPDAETPAEEVIPPTDDDTVEEVKAKRFRLRPRTSQEEAIFAAMAADPNLTYEDGKAKLFPATPAATPAAEESAPVVDSATLFSEIDALELKIIDLEAEYDSEGAKAAKLELREKRKALETLSRQATEAKAPEAKPETSPQADAHRAAYDADWRETVGMAPVLADETARESDPVWIEMKQEHARRVAKNDPLLQSPSLNSTLYLMAVAKLGRSVQRVNPPASAAPVSRVAPGPVSGSARSAAAPPPVDTRSLLSTLSPAALRMALHGGD